MAAQQPQPVAESFTLAQHRNRQARCAGGNFPTLCDAGDTGGIFAEAYGCVLFAPDSVGGEDRFSVVFPASAMSRVPVSETPAFLPPRAAVFPPPSFWPRSRRYPDLRPFPARRASPALGPDRSSDVPDGLVTCRLRTRTSLARSSERGGGRSVVGLGKLFRRANSGLEFVNTINAHYYTKLFDNSIISKLGCD